MRFDFDRVTGTLVRRYKRFLADVVLENGETVTAHCPNTGRMDGCAIPGSPVILSRATNPNRRLSCTLELVFAEGRWLNVNTMRPNLLVQEAVQAGRVAELEGWRFVRREAAWGRSRFDLLLVRGGASTSDPSACCYIEVKNVTLFHEGVAYFPDAVTTRGAKHLADLADVVAGGGRAVQMYVVNDAAARLLRPADVIDAAYGRALREAARKGVEVLAYTWSTTPEGMEVAGGIEVDLAE